MFGDFISETMSVVSYLVWRNLWEVKLQYQKINTCFTNVCGLGEYDSNDHFNRMENCVTNVTLPLFLSYLVLAYSNYVCIKF